MSKPENSKIKFVSIFCTIVMVATVFSVAVKNVSAENTNKEEIILPDLENWHYRVPLIVDSGDYNRTDCILTQEINVVKEIGGFGSFDNNSVSVIEMNETGFPLWEVISQFEWIDDSSIYVTWLTNGTTPANTKRFYSIYFDILEYGPKSKAVYPELVTKKINNEQLWVCGEDYEVKIDRERGGSREVKINDVPRKGFIYDQTWQSWHSENLNWSKKGAETKLVEDGPIYKKVKIVSSDKKQTLCWYFYPDRMKIVFDGVGEISFDAIADNLLNTNGILVWDDYLFENLTKNYQEYSQPCSYFYMLDPELNSSNDDVKGRSGFWADTEEGEEQKIINAGEKGTRWILGGNEAWFGFAKNEVIRDVVLKSQNPPEITREYSWIVMESPVIEDEKVFENQVVVIKGDLTVKNGGTLVSIDSSLIVHGNITIEENGELYIVSSRELLPPKPPELPPWPPLPPRPPRPPIRPPIRSAAVAGDVSVNGKLFIAKDTLSMCSENDGVNGINVNPTSTFECYNATITAFSGEIPVSITNQKICYEKYYYRFDVKGEAQIDGSKISCLYDGIRILNGSDVSIQNCRISDSAGNGIFIGENCTPVINDNTITDCGKVGIFINSTLDKEDKNTTEEKNPTENYFANLTKANDIWEVKTEMDKLPDQDGWTLYENYEADCASIINGILRLDFPVGETGVKSWEYLSYWNADTTIGTTTEFRLKTVSFFSTHKFFLNIADGSYLSLFWISYNGDVHLTSSSLTGVLMSIDTSVFHTYRITQKNGVAKLYIDGVLEGTVSLNSCPSSQIWFGDTLIGYEERGVLDIDYVYYSRKGAFEPGVIKLPAAKVDIYQKIGEVNKDIEFDGEGIGSIKLYEWDFEGDGIYDWNSSISALTIHAYNAVGTYFPVLRVTDDNGVTDTDYLRVNVWDPTQTNLYKNKIFSSGEGIHLEGMDGNIINCMVYNCTYGVYCDDSSPTIKDSWVFWNEKQDLYLSQNSKPVTINASYNRTRVYLGDTDNYDDDNWTDYQELYVYGFNPYVNDSDKENNNADFDDDGITNIKEGATHGTDPLNPDTDNDGIKDHNEINGVNPRYVVNKGEKGYLFYVTAPPSYSNTFDYKTNCLNPDTDFDSQNDYNDPVPLDYDMDGDGYINDGGLIFSTWPTYVERLAIAANNDPNILHWPSDNDMDDDGLTWAVDDDDDADGMSDDYEKKYGSAAVAANIVNGKGWQHPYIHNARYAVLIVGGGTEPAGTLLNGNHDAFWNDGMELYDKLATDYRYIDENIYLLHSHGWRTGERNWTTDSRWDGEATVDNINNTFNKLKYNITINDFFFFAEICHGGDEPGSRIFKVNNQPVESMFFYRPDIYTPLKQTLDYQLDKLSPARMCVVLQSCYPGYAFAYLSKEDRIVISAAKWDELTYTWKSSYPGGPSQQEAAEHWEFLYNDKGDGFLRAIGNINSSVSVLQGYYSGYDAAKDKDFGEDDNKISHALLEDCWVDGIGGHEKDYLSETDPNKDGYLAKHTYL